MKWFINMTTKKKLFSGFGVITMLLIIAVLVCYTGIEQIQESHRLLYKKEFQIAVALKDIRANQNGLRANVLFLIAVKDPPERQSRIADVKDRSKAIVDDIQKLREILKNEPKRMAKFEEFVSIADAFALTRDTQVLPLLLEGKVEDAKELIVGIQTERDTKMRALVDALIRDVEKEASQSFENSIKSGNRSILVFIIISIIAVVFSTVIVFFLNQIIANPLNDIKSIAVNISSGNLLVNIPSTDREDEIGALARAFSLMIRSLKEKAQIAEKIAAGNLTVEVTPLSDADTLGNAFSTMVVKLRKQIQEIVEGVNVLASSGSEIMASVSQLTSGAAETSTAVSETTTTVEEVKQTAAVSAQKARHVADLGQKNVEISQAGLKSIEDTINGMNRIREQVESIADMVVRLSEQSQAIGEIIATVNDIAEQSNLLAVNASIEAAKAGEQGKGFAVVAQEIRSLAAQSKQATTQVRKILFDVQKAISSAVMATEQGSKAVEEGVRLSTQAGEAIDTLAESVTEATDAAIQIAASSQQQRVGMDQVVSAMENIRQATSQMAASTKQTEKAAHDLHNLGSRLQNIVKLYKV
jgi:methyl-accepting chemotaxis protein